MRRVFKIFWTMILAMAALLFATAILMQTAAVQTFLAKKAVNVLGKHLNAEVRFSKIHLKPFNAVVLKDAVLLDPMPDTSRTGEILDTIARAESVTASFSLRGIFRKEGIHIRKAAVSNGSFMIVTSERGSNLKRAFASDSTAEKEKKKPGDILDARHLELNNFRFRLINTEEQSNHEYGIKWEDLDVLVHNLEGRKISFSGGDITGELTSLSLSEKSGYAVSKMSGKTKIGHGEAVINDLVIHDLYSDLNFALFKMAFQKERPFFDFLHRVRITAMMTESEVNFESIAYFAASFRNRGMVLKIAGMDVDGTISDLAVNRLQFKEQNSGAGGVLEGRISGLPDMSDFRLDLNARNLDFTSKGIEHILTGWAPGSKAKPGRFASSQDFRFNGRLSGLLDRLAVKGKITTRKTESLTADVAFSHLISKGLPMSVAGKIETDNLDLGTIMNIKMLGPVTLRSSLHANLGSKAPSLRIDSLRIDRLNAMEYDYSHIIGAGTFSQNAFNGRIVSSDPNLNFLFQGIFTFSDKTSNGLYKFFADIGYADLDKLHLSTLGINKIFGQINANYVNVERKELLGELEVNNLVLENSQGTSRVGNIRVQSHSSDNIHRINLASDMVSGSYVGDKPVTSLFFDLMQLTLKREMPALLTKEHNNWNKEKYAIDISLHDKKNLLSYIIPGLYVADSTSLKFRVNENGNVTANLLSPRIAKGRNYLRNLNLLLDNANESINGNLTSTEASVSSLYFKNMNMMLFAADNSFGFGITYDNQTEADNRGELYLNGNLERNDKGILMLHGNTLPSNIYVDGDGWNIAQSSFELKGKDISLNKIVAVCNNQRISVDGGISPSSSDTLRLEMTNYDISMLNKLLAADAGIKGTATGKVYLMSPRKDKSGLLMNLTCDSLSIGGYSMGTFQMGSALDNSRNSLNFIARNNLNGSRNIDIRGDYGLGSSQFDATVSLDSFNLGYISPFLSSLFRRMEGNISGTIKAKGPVDRLQLSSRDAKFEDALVQVDFTKVSYTINGPFHLDGTGLHFDDDQIKDSYNGTGVLSGGLLFSNLKDFLLDTKLKVNQIEALNTTPSDNPAFNGHIFASGDVSITGPFNAIFIDVNARTAKEGSIRIPIDNASNAKNSNLLTFKEAERYEYIDPYDLIINNLNLGRKKQNDFGIKLRINATQGVEANVEIDRSAGNVITGRGNGQIELNVRPSRNVFTINGDYTISQGNFHFNAMNIAQRDFSLNDGSTIRFNGDIMESRLDITGLYTTKASVATLIADTTAISTRRTVNCEIGISGKLKEPSLDFSIDIPDLDPTTKGKVESALNTEDKVQRQFLALLISNSFMPNEQSGVVNNTSTLYSSVAEIMAGQLNNILNKLNIPLDLGLNYQTSESGSNIFDVAVSTQLFNNRVIVNGAFGNRDYTSTTSSSSKSDVVGDIDIEIKLDKPGKIRLNLFSHSADAYTNYLDNTQRNGIGIAYQVEFNKLKDFIHRMFTRKKNRSETVETEQKEKVTITIKD